MARTKEAKGKKVKVEVEVSPLKGETKELTLTITELQAFGNEEMINLVNKVNEIIKFINK